jgi:alkylation response protein AidB-like acyl-CoA dehydrogenase
MTTATTPSMHLVPDADELAIREALRGICAPFGQRYSRECHSRGEPPRELWEALSEKGYVGANIDEEWGGGGLGMSGLQIVAEEIAAAGGATLMLVVSSGIAGSILSIHGTDSQRDRWLRGIAAGTTRMAFAITEPDAGTNSHNLRTVLQRDGDRYLLSGQKTFISGVEDATQVLVVARLRGAEGELGKPCLCIVDVDVPGSRVTRSRCPTSGPTSSGPCSSTASRSQRTGSSAARREGSRRSSTGSTRSGS